MLSFHDLLTYDSPINYSIIHSFLSVIRSSHDAIAFTDTSFHRHLHQHGWLSAFHKYFLHSESSTYAKKSKFKPTLLHPVIIIPIHIHDSHWVTLTRRKIGQRIIFLFSDNLNAKNTEETVRSLYSSNNTSLQPLGYHVHPLHIFPIPMNVVPDPCLHQL
jgi:hypothetical protein